MRWDDLRLFLAVVEQGSLSGAARQLKLGQPTLSRRIAELEERCGEPLFARQHHGSSLTAAGLALLPSAQRMAEWASEAALCMNGQRHLPSGTVRIAAPPGVAYELLAPMAAQLRRDCPQIRLEVMSSVETLNLGRGEADLALRTTHRGEPDLIEVDRLDTSLGAYASAQYAARLPPQYTLAQIDWICWAPPYERQSANLELQRLIPGFQPAFTSDDFIVQMAASRAGVGALVLFDVVHRYSALRGLQRLNIDLGPAARGTLHLVCHKRQRTLPKVDLVIELIGREFSRARAAQAG